MVRHCIEFEGAELGAIPSVERTLGRKLDQLEVPLNEIVVRCPVVSAFGINKLHDLRTAPGAIVSNSINLTDLMTLLPCVGPKLDQAKDSSRW